MSHQKYFSIEEARDVLDEIEPKIQEIIELKHDLDALGFDLTSNSSYSDVDPDRIDEVTGKIDRIEELLKNIEEKGILFKDPTFELGIVDFPYLRDDKEVYLCWMLGEDDLKYWHYIEDGMKGRQPINEL